MRLPNLAPIGLDDGRPRAQQPTYQLKTSGFLRRR